MGILILRRKPRQAVVIGKNITVWILAIEGDKVKLGFDAPEDVTIVRAELLDEGPILPGPQPRPLPPQAP